MIDLEKEREEFSNYNGRYPSNPKEDDGLTIWLKRAEIAQAEITELKQKLARYEDPDYVVVPRRPTADILHALDSGLYYDFADTTFDSHEAYKSMIEAVEKDDANPTTEKMK